MGANPPDLPLRCQERHDLRRGTRNQKVSAEPVDACTVTSETGLGSP